MESWPVLILLSIILLFFAWGVMGVLVRMQTTRENRKIAEAKFAELQKKKEIFKYDVAKLGNQNGIEESIREKFPVVKEGEGLIIVVDDNAKIEEKDEEKKGFFSSLLFWRD